MDLQQHINWFLNEPEPEPEPLNYNSYGARDRIQCLRLIRNIVMRDMQEMTRRRCLRRLSMRSANRNLHIQNRIGRNPSNFEVSPPYIQMRSMDLSLEEISYIRQWFDNHNLRPLQHIQVVLTKAETSIQENADSESMQTVSGRSRGLGRCTCRQSRRNIESRNVSLTRRGFPLSRARYAYVESESMQTGSDRSLGLGCSTCRRSRPNIEDRNVSLMRRGFPLIRTSYECLMLRFVENFDLPHSSGDHTYHQRPFQRIQNSNITPLNIEHHTQKGFHP